MRVAGAVPAACPLAALEGSAAPLAEQWSKESKPAESFSLLEAAAESNLQPPSAAPQVHRCSTRTRQLALGRQSAAIIIRSSSPVPIHWPVALGIVRLPRAQSDRAQTSLARLPSSETGRMEVITLAMPMFAPRTTNSMRPHCCLERATAGSQKAGSALVRRARTINNFEKAQLVAVLAATSFKHSAAFSIVSIRAS